MNGTETPSSSKLDEARPPLERTDFASVVVAADAGLSIRIPPLPGTMEFRGDLVRIDCSAEGARLSVEGDGVTAEFLALDPFSIAFVTFRAGVGDSISCGPVSPARPVLVNYAPDPEKAEGRSLGNPDRVVFLPQ